MADGNPVAPSGPQRPKETTGSYGGFGPKAGGGKPKVTPSPGGTQGGSPKKKNPK